MTVAPRRIVVGLSGGIAAYKAIEVVRELTRAGTSVRTVMTESATRFVGPITLTGLTGTPAVVDLWDDRVAGEIHVELGAWADAMVVAPATMNVLGRVASGLADDALTATIACMKGPVLFAPAMHTRMWHQGATQRNVRTLRADGFHFVGPVEGPLASGESGMGRMAEPRDIVAAVLALLDAPRDLEGMSILITAGPTIEDLDPVRFLGNRSTGKMGFAIAQRARDRGARVVLVSGPVDLPDPPDMEVVRVRSALDMHGAVMARGSGVDAVIMSAAVADYRAKTYATEKVKKGEDIAVELVRNPDILMELGHSRAGATPVLIGFAVETNDVESYARDKLVRKKVDLIVANEASVGFGGDDNVATLVSHEGALPLPRMSKLDLADRILDRVRELHSGRKPA